MLHDAPIAVQKTPHVVVVGNEKGGSGKTTIAMHVAVALLKEGQRVGTIDLDSNQRSLTHYIENRCIWANHQGIELETPIHSHIPRAEGAKLDENEADELAAFEAVIAGFGQSVDFLVFDTPAHDSYLMRLAHLAADTLLTPLNDSFLDFGTLASIDPVTHEITETGHYAAMVGMAAGSGACSTTPISIGWSSATGSHFGDWWRTALTNSRCVWGSDRSTVAPSGSCIANCSPRD
jgi:chromosome partitioning protein